MKKNVLKKFAAAALAAATVMSSMSVMAFADEAETTAKTGSVTITKCEGTENGYETLNPNYGAVNTTVSGERLNNVEFAYIEVGTREQVEVNKDGTRTTEMLYTLIDTAAKELEVTPDVTEATGVKYYRMSTLDTAIRGHKKEAIDLVKNARDNHATLTTNDGTVKFTGLSLEKLYLFAETDASGATKAQDNKSVAVTKVSVPFFVSLPFTDKDGNSVTDIYAYPKNSTGTATIDKKIVEGTEEKVRTTANIGDTINYKVTYKIPVGEKGLDSLVVTDKMSKGLTFVNPVEVKKENDIVASQNYKVDSSTDNGITTTTITFTSDYCKTLEKNITHEFTITYKATLNDQAVLGKNGNTNTVFVEYTNTGDIKRRTDDKTTTVLTYGIDLQKQFEGTTTIELNGVKFTLTDESDKAVNVDKKTSNTFYTPGGKSNEEETDADGKIYIRGLKPGTYKLTETKTKDGYVLLKDPVVIKITPSTNEEEAAKGVVTAYVGTKEVTMTDDNGSATAIVPLTVVNSKGFDLPVTGGRGIALFTIAGIAIVAAAGSLLFMRKRSK